LWLELPSGYAASGLERAEYVLVRGKLVAGAVEAVKRVRLLDRKSVRQRFEQRFSVARMANDYLRIYNELANGGIERVAA
jgi:hypothetical protein